jgi:hypothetical protein
MPSTSDGGVPAVCGHIKAKAAKACDAVARKVFRRSAFGAERCCSSHCSSTLGRCRAGQRQLPGRRSFCMREPQSQARAAVSS